MKRETGPITLEEVGLEPAVPERSIVHLPSGRQVEISAQAEERVQIRGRDGLVELTVILGERGPRLVFEAAELDLRAAGAVNIDCRQLNVRASESLALEAPRARLEATRGDLELKANDNVVAVGEEIRLNCDKPEVVPTWLQREVGARLASAKAAPMPTPPQQVLGDASLLDGIERPDGD
jgi:hypothetical protein